MKVEYTRIQYDLVDEVCGTGSLMEIAQRSLYMFRAYVLFFRSLII